MNFRTNVNGYEMNMKHEFVCLKSIIEAGDTTIQVVSELLIKTTDFQFL